MNRRQKLKKLKQDNKFMRMIINRTPEMKWLYDAYQQPLNVNHYTMTFDEYHAKRRIPPYMADLEEYVEHTREATAMDLCHDIKDRIYTEVHAYSDGSKEVEATLFIGVGKAR